MIDLATYGVLCLLWLAVIVLASAWPDDDGERTPRRPKVRPPRRIPLPQLAEWNPELSTAELVRLQELEFIMAEDDEAVTHRAVLPQARGWHAGHARLFGWHAPRH